MIDLNRSLGENLLSDLAFSVIQKFSTQRPLQTVLKEIFFAIGRDLCIWSGADVVTHVFVNPDLNESHRMVCIGLNERFKEKPPESLNYDKLEAKPEVPEFHLKSQKDLWKAHRIKICEDDSVLKVALKDEDFNTITGDIWISQFDFAKALPLGHFCVCWLDQPKLKETDIQHIQDVLCSLSGALAKMLKNHFTIHENTYLPSYYLEGYKSAAIMFADIRNSTALFEIARLGGLTYTQSVDIFLKVWLGYAADLISDRQIGYIHGFSGDGFMATFGEYIVGTPEKPADQIACVIALHTAKYLLECFKKLYTRWRNHSIVKNFYRNYNEDVELNLGIGINFGEIYFSYFGTSALTFPQSDCIYSPGHLEFTAIGDHVNTTERLEGIAAKIAGDINLIHRGSQFLNELKISPIVISQTVSNRISDIFFDDEGELSARRGIAHLKGKGTALPFFEIEESKIDIQKSEKLLKGVARDQYRNCIQNPPDIKNYVQYLESELDHLLEKEKK